MTIPPLNSAAALRLALSERDAGALFVVNHSGGKDSQATLIRVLEVVPASQILVVHAGLRKSEWDGALELAEEQAKAAGVPFIVADAGKSFLEMVERRFLTRPEVPSWPSASTRQCTSDLKRGPITREVRRHAKARGITRLVNCMGMRAAESSARSRKQPWAEHAAHGAAGRSWYDWLPIHDLTTAEVFGLIADAGQQPHPAYALGNERLSCVFCVMASASDLRHGAEQNPELYAKYVELERRTGYTMHMSRKSLPELTGIWPGDGALKASLPPENTPSGEGVREHGPRPLPWGGVGNLPPPASHHSAAAPAPGRPPPKVGYRYTLQWHTRYSEPRDGLDRIQGEAFALSSRPEHKPPELEARWQALGGPRSGFSWHSQSLTPPPQRHSAERRGKQRTGNLKRRVERTIGPLFSGDVIAQALAQKPGYYEGEEISAEAAAYVAECDRQAAEDWAAYVAWYLAQPED